MRRFVELRPALEAAPAVAAAWVFGSLARGEAREDSDLDVAVLLRVPEATILTHRRELMELAARLELAAGRPVDLVVLGLHDPILAQRVLSEGVLVHDPDPDRRTDFTSDALARYLDWAPRYGQPCVGRKGGPLTRSEIADKAAFVREALDELAAIPQGSFEAFLGDRRNPAPLRLGRPIPARDRVSKSDRAPVRSRRSADRLSHSHGGSQRSGRALAAAPRLRGFGMSSPF